MHLSQRIKLQVKKTYYYDENRWYTKFQGLRNSFSLALPPPPCPKSMKTQKKRLFDILSMFCLLNVSKNDKKY